jgi:hypothetical protein
MGDERLGDGETIKNEKRGTQGNGDGKIGG